MVGFLCSSAGKESTCNAGGPGLGKSHGESMATHSSILAWRESPWTAEPGGLQSMGSQRVGHNWATKQSTREMVNSWINLLECPSSLEFLKNHWLFLSMLSYELTLDKVPSLEVYNKWLGLSPLRLL